MEIPPAASKTVTEAPATAATASTEVPGITAAPAATAAPVAEVPAPTTAPFAEAPAFTIEAAAATTNASAPVAMSETETTKTDIETHKTAAAPKSILKESRITLVENKTTTTINKWIKGDPPVQKPIISTKPVAAEETTTPETAKPADSFAAAIAPAATFLAGSDDLPPINLSQREEIASGPRKRRQAAKSVLKPAKEEAAKKLKLTETANPPAPKTKDAAAKPAAKKAPASKPDTKPATTTTTGRSSAAVEVWSGAPDDVLGEGLTWSEGWTKKKFERQSGATKGTFDSYWYTPILKKRLRSLTEVRRFMKALEANEGDEEKAWKEVKK